MKLSQKVAFDVILSHAKNQHSWSSSNTRQLLIMAKIGCSAAKTRLICVRIWWNFHRMSVLMLSWRLQKISIGFRVLLGAKALQTQEKCFKWPKTEIGPTITRLLCVKIRWNFHGITVFMLICRIKKISIGFWVRLGAGALRTQEKFLKWPKTGVARP